MRSLSRVMGIVVCLWVMGAVFPNNAFAYIDPGSGNYLTQVLVAFFAGLAYTIQHWWRSIIGFFQRLFSKKDK